MWIWVFVTTLFARLAGNACGMEVTTSERLRHGGDALTQSSACVLVRLQYDWILDSHESIGLLAFGTEVILNNADKVTFTDCPSSFGREALAPLVPTFECVTDTCLSQRSIAFCIAGRHWLRLNLLTYVLFGFWNEITFRCGNPLLSLTVHLRSVGRHWLRLYLRLNL